MTPSIGIAMFPEHGNDAQSLLKNADGAMYEAKASGRNQLRLYDGAMQVRALKRLSLEMELRRAVENSSLEVYYQPKYHAHDLTLLGGEALLRWFHPERGQISTADFIAVAEETGLIGDIGRGQCSGFASTYPDGAARASICPGLPSMYLAGTSCSRTHCCGCAKP